MEDIIKEIDKAMELIDRVDFNNIIYLNPSQEKYKDILEQEGYEVKITPYIPEGYIIKK